MSHSISHASDPRTIARDIAGVFEAVFPQLVPGVVSHFNRAYSYSSKDCSPIPKNVLSKSSLQPAMLFELAVTVAESNLAGECAVNWDLCLDKARIKQQMYYDAELPDVLKPIDKEVALAVANNLTVILREIAASQNSAVFTQPRIPGYRWIASGVGDFATNTSIIEVKCSSRRFSTADYRQLVIYWLLSCLEGLEKELPRWTTGILLNPRSNFIVKFEFNDFIPLIASQRSLIEIVESFGAIFDDNAAHEAAAT